MVQHLLARRGAARIALIPPEVLEALNAGLVPTVNLNEFLALDLPRLASSVAGHIGLDARSERLVDTLAMLAAFKPLKRHHHIALALYDLAGAHPRPDDVADAIARHPSDIARSWAAQWVGYSGLALPQKLASVRRFAADPHFGVREMAWLAVRDEVVREPSTAITLLDDWVRDSDANIRRFASELTRPHGVWCAPVPALKAEPWLALALLDPLKSDASLYVRNSVANWLNDASRTQPEWVHEVCRRWTRESRTPETAYIARRAQRTLMKKAPD
ncbi:DNA alkylation repair protein [Ramlibacter humi]|uniref:DNA alkylation repair protein n=1 Tax=Ramlibacter humi TaxID=2530451 RepID=A0A4Z0BYT9_9BURK|nr:DNA alkylation repair protein [Ramlibacter humi]TFZ03694.1 DNA alkylation repair protein [Ramlibacter humi]